MDAALNSGSAMSIRTLARAEWRSYCDRVSKQIAGRRVELDVASLDLGDHVEARWLPLLGIVFDSRSDVLEIALDGVGHSIVSPREVVLEETERGLVAIEIVAAGDTVEILRFREPLRLGDEGRKPTGDEPD
jgi:uncharacterized protein DUF5335